MERDNWERRSRDGKILGLRNDVPLNIIEQTKIYFEKLWTKRVKKVGI